MGTLPCLFVAPRGRLCQGVFRGALWKATPAAPAGSASGHAETINYIRRSPGFITLRDVYKCEGGIVKGNTGDGFVWFFNTFLCFASFFFFSLIRKQK